MKKQKRTQRSLLQVEESTPDTLLLGSDVSESWVRFDRDDRDHNKLVIDSCAIDDMPMITANVLEEVIDWLTECRENME